MGSKFLGGVAERRGNGLQIRVHGFKSRLHLGRLARSGALFNAVADLRPPLPTNGDRMQPDIEAWESWHPRDFAARMEGADLPWFVAGGWAIDLFLGTRTRDHEDLEVAVPPRLSGYCHRAFPTSTSGSHRAAGNWPR